MNDYKKEALEDFIDDFEDALERFEDSTSYLRSDLQGTHREAVLNILHQKLDALKSAKKTKDVNKVADMELILDEYGEE